MKLMEQIIARAKSQKQRIVLPESLEERTLTAADKALADDLADIILIGAQKDIFALADKLGLKNIAKATIIDPATSEQTETYVQLLYNLRKNKGMTEEQAREKVMDPLYYGCLIIKNGDADGQISGALSTTGDTLRPALQIIKCAPGVSCVSGAMLMITPAKEYGEDGVLVMGDVAVTPMPDANQLAQIAVCTAQTARSVAGFQEPRVAMLSFSTKGSASHEVVDKVVEATKKANEAANYKAAPIKDTVSFEEFEKLDIRVGLVKDCQKVKKSKKLLQFTIDDGSGTDRTICSGIAAFYENPEELIGKRILFVANFAPRNMMGIESQGMILSAIDADESLSVVTTTKDVKPGSQVG